MSRKKIKNINLYVKPPHGQVSVSAPLWVSDAAIDKFVRAKIDWIQAQIAKIKSKPRPVERQYATGESLYLWGKSYYLQVELGAKYSLELQDDKAIFIVRANSTIKQRENYIRKWYREILELEIDKQLPKWEQITGFKANDWQTKHMKTRWGTCNTTTKKIWLNLQLAKKNPICLEYVILHELLHLAEKKHNQKFYSLMTKYMPNWKEIKNDLNAELIHLDWCLEISW